MATIFTKIIQGEIPSYKIAEDENFYAFLDINPNAKGHTLVVPKKEVNKLFDLDKTTYQNLFLFARRVAIALEKSVPCERIGLSVIGLEVPHVHIHLIPLQEMKDATFGSKISMTNDEFNELAAQIRQNFK